MGKYDKSSDVQISAVFGTHWHIDCQIMSETGIFRQIFNHIFRSP